MIAPGFEYSCGDALGVATLLFNSTDECAHIQSAEDICCQKKGNQSLILNVDAALDAASYETGDG